jgi:tetratricopeptide (TPR) repeat protein
MTCEDVERDEIAEQYLLGRLPDADQEQFEAHYFDCPRCLERLRLLEELGAELSRDAGSGRSRPWLWRAAAGLAAAAVIVLAVRVAQDSDGRVASDEPGGAPTRAEDVALPTLEPPPAAPSTPVVSRLGEIDPPAYSPPRLRGVTTQAQREFRAAMELYAARDYAGASTGLRRAVAMDDSLVPAHFYLGVSYLQTDRIAEAVQELQRSVAFGESAYLEDAHFFLAKAHIRQEDWAAARSQLTDVIALEGDRREEATRLLAQLP